MRVEGANKPATRGYGWMADDNRPTLTLTYPHAGVNAALSRIVVGMWDYDTGLNLDSFVVKADFALDGVAAGENLASKFKPATRGVWEWQLDKPLAALEKGRITVAIKDNAGNVTRIERTFAAGPAASGGR